MLNRIRYRGYLMKVAAKGPRYEVHIEPSRADVPILSRSHVVSFSQAEAIDEAERRVDRLLSAYLAPRVRRS